MKKILCLILALAARLSLFACGKQSDQTNENSDQTTATIKEPDTTEKPSVSTEETAPITSPETSSEEKTVSPTNPTTPNNPATPDTPAHTHSFTAATCTQPKTCSCGATEGNALGDRWADATCKAPKTCSICNITEGNSLNHNFNNYICTNCGEEDVEGKKTNPLYALVFDKTYYKFASITNMQDDRELKVVTLYFSKDAKICSWAYTDYSSQSSPLWDDSNNQSITYNNKTYYYRGGIGTSYNYTLTDSLITLTEDGAKVAELSCEKDGTIKLIQGSGLGLDANDKLSLLK